MKKNEFTCLMTMTLALSLAAWRIWIFTFTPLASARHAWYWMAWTWPNRRWETAYM